MDLMRFGQVFACHFVTIFVFDHVRTANALCNLRPGQLLGAGSPANRAAIQFRLISQRPADYRVKALPVKKKAISCAKGQTLWRLQSFRETRQAVAILLAEPEQERKFEYEP